MNDNFYMKKALYLAKKAKLQTLPNPMVGCVIVNDGGKIVGQGYHRFAGDLHAERHALKDAGDLAKNATLYVNLEPCNHYGRTPPCTDAIIESGIKRVVIATEDPNPIVKGQGIDKLRKHGIEVITGVLKEDAQKLNEVYITNHTKKRPFIMMKGAMTIDGKIAAIDGSSKWITGEEARRYVHYLRSLANGIIVGLNTVITDNPKMNVRGRRVKKQPYRLVIDGRLDIPVDSQILAHKDGQTIIVSVNEYKDKIKKIEDKGHKVWIMSELSPHAIARRAYEEGIYLLMIEGGMQTFTSFLAESLIDKFYFFISPMILGAGLPIFSDIGIGTMSDAINLRFGKHRKMGKDILIEAYPHVSGTDRTYG